jgi:ubiquitin-protein ligase
MASERISWQEVEASRLAREKREMQDKASDLTWIERSDELPAGGWEGEAPEWPMERPQPKGLGKLLGGRRLKVRVVYSEGFPMDPPRLIPLDPKPEFGQRFQHKLHLNADGSVCLIRLASDWTGEATAADLVEKASAWFIEWCAMEAGLITEMSNGVYSDDYLDEKLDQY